MRLAILASPALAAVLANMLAATLALADDFLRKWSPHGVDETVERLENALEEGGASLIATVDHTAAAEEAGMELRPTALVIFGNPRLGTPLMQQAQSLALDLPLRVAVYEDADGETTLVYPDLQQATEAHGMPAGSLEVESIMRALEALTDKAVREE